MRAEFANAMVELAERDERIVLLTGDLGFTVLEPFAERHPQRFYNVGVAEQNMVGLATGLAEAGLIPFVYSIATFASLRPYEFIRNGPALHELPVRIVGVGGGLDYGHNGVTHYALEDVAVLRVQPSLTVLAPADPHQALAVLAATEDVPTPVYFRLGKEAQPVPGLDGRFALGRAEAIGEGEDVAIVALGTMAGEAVEAARLLAERDIAATVVVVASVSPPPVEDLLDALGRVRLALTVEAHYRVGGVGSLVCEVVAEHGLDCRVVRRGVDRMPRGVTGTQRYLYDVFGLSAAQLADCAVEALAPIRR
ncbi:MAG: 1-deoxy-D-xylulose-5-phosphate synthase [Actinomycetota bacterium]|nr:1-deoxy-D-xylulose-5-phosphate synthase [Actinomycetota bacterium]